MPPLQFFSREQVIGVFRGFTGGGLEFHADLVLPYRNDFQRIPMHGQFVLVQLETPQEAVLGRITSFESDGKLSGGAGEEFNIRAVREDRPVPEDLREQYLKYRVNIRVLGVLRANASGRADFVASHRRLPHVGSPVAFPSTAVLREIAGHNNDGAGIGHLAYGEYVYVPRGAPGVKEEPWMQFQPDDVGVRFPIERLVSRRSFIFARAGFGKSNLNKLLFSKLYEGTPTVEKRGGRMAPVGTVIFDVDGEYFWPDDKGRPGFCDVPHLKDKVVVFTPRAGPSAYYQSFVSGGVKLDIRRLRPGDVIAIALGPERQDQQNVRKLRGLNAERWEELVNLIDRYGNDAALEDIGRLLQLNTSQEVEALAARANMTAIVRMLHDPRSQLMDLLILALSEGKLCIVDVSQLRGQQALVLSGLILRRIFDRNQHEFTKAEPATIPVLAVVEEAQAVLSETATSAEPYIAWVKEGRKYDLGAVLVTQQPGSIPHEILSQGDNWFIFHLLSAGDLGSVRKANAHFSDDLLGSLLNEPIQGQGVFWSSVGGTAYPVPIRVLSFEHLHTMADPKYEKPATTTYAGELRKRMAEQLRVAMPAVAAVPASAPAEDPQGAAGVVEVNGEMVPSPTVVGRERGDPMQGLEDAAVERLRTNEQLMQRLREGGVAWGSLKAFFAEGLPQGLDDRENVAFGLVKKVMARLFPSSGEGWHAFKHQERNTTYVKIGPKP